jgi:hypothetical protein
VTAVERAAHVYHTEPCARSFTEDVEAHLLHGFVVSRPDLFIMFRPVVRSADPRLIVDPQHRFNSAECDCWHVFLAAGNLAIAWRFEPWPLPWLSWEVKNVLRFARTAKIRGLSHLAHQ